MSSVIVNTPQVMWENVLSTYQKSLTQDHDLAPVYDIMGKFEFEIFCCVVPEPSPHQPK